MHPATGVNNKDTEVDTEADTEADTEVSIPGAEVKGDRTFTTLIKEMKTRILTVLNTMRCKFLEYNGVKHSSNYKCEYIQMTISLRGT